MFETEVEKFMDNVFPYDDEEPMYGEEQVKGLLAIFAESVHNKANEWHYVKDGDLPKEDKQYLCCILSWVGGAEVYACLIYNTQYHSWQESYGDVIKWKEIE